MLLHSWWFVLFFGCFFTYLADAKRAQKSSTTLSPLDAEPIIQEHDDADFEKLLMLYNRENEPETAIIEGNEKPLIDSESVSSQSESSESKSNGDEKPAVPVANHPLVNPWIYSETNASIEPTKRPINVDNAFFGEWTQSNESDIIDRHEQRIVLPPLTNPYKPPELKSDKLPKNAKLEYVMAFWRHGERNPLKSYNGDPHFEEYAASGWSQLTVKGIQQLENVGRRTRHRYTTEIPLLSPKLNASEVYFMSTDIDRALISAQAFLIGFAQPAAISVPDSPTWPKGFYPIPIHVGDSNLYGPFGAPCKRFIQLHNRVKQSAWSRDIESRAATAIAAIAAEIGTGATLKDLDDFLENIAMTKAMGKSIPAYMEPYVTMFDDIFIAYYRLSFGFFGINEAAFDFAHEFAMLTSGSIGRFVVDTLQKRVLSGQAQVTEATKFFGFSGHDVTLAAVQRAIGLLDIPYGRPANYGATLALELWHSDELVSRGKDGGYFVKIVYFNDSIVNDAIDLSPMILGCSDGRCPLDILTQNAYRIVPEPSYRELCELDVNTKEVAATANMKRVSIVLSFVVMLLLL